MLARVTFPIAGISRPASAMPTARMLYTRKNNSGDVAESVDQAIQTLHVPFPVASGWRAARAVIAGVGKVRV